VKKAKPVRKGSQARRASAESRVASDQLGRKAILVNAAREASAVPWVSLDHKDCQASVEPMDEMAQWGREAKKARRAKRARQVKAVRAVLEALMASRGREVTAALKAIAVIEGKLVKKVSAEIAAKKASRGRKASAANCR
jgi:hypothetical protein